MKSEMVEKEMAVLMGEVGDKEELCVFCSMFMLFERID